MKQQIIHPKWALEHKKPGTELKLINGRYYLYAVKSQYDKVTKRSKKISLGILGSINEKDGFVASEKKLLKEKSSKSYFNKEIFSLEYGFSKWMLDTITNEGILNRLKLHFPSLWQFIVFMSYCRIAHQSPLKNIGFHLEQSDLLSLLDWNEKIYDQKISDLLFELGSMQDSIHEYMQPKDDQKRTVLMDATDIVLQSKNIELSQKGYNSHMDFQPQFVLLYLYDAASLQPLYYRVLAGNIREISALKNTIKISGIADCVYIADKGFFSESNISELEKLNMQYIIPLKRDNKLIPYETLNNIDLTDNYFEYLKRFIFYADTVKSDERKINLFVDGKLKEQEKADYLTRIQSLPESFSKLNFNEKVKTMGTLTLIHNTESNPEQVYNEYKHRCEIEQFFDHLKNTLDASSTSMQREESLNGWMFINHISMQVIYKLYKILKTTPLNKKQTLNHKYSIVDTVEHLKSIKKIKFNATESVIAEINKPTKTLLEKMKISIT